MERYFTQGVENLHLGSWNIQNPYICHAAGMPQINTYMSINFWDFNPYYGTLTHIICQHQACIISILTCQRIVLSGLQSTSFATQQACIILITAIPIFCSYGTLICAVYYQCIQLAICKICINNSWIHTSHSFGTDLSPHLVTFQDKISNKYISIK